MAEKKMRNSNLEFLRILSMVMIILAHYGGHGGIIDNAASISGHVLGLFLKTGGKLGVMCFVLISTYFLCEQKFKLEILIKTVLQMSFYAFLILGILLVSGQPVGIGAIVKTIFPLPYSLYWFVTAYCGMYLAQPLLKKCINHLTEKQSKLILNIWFVFLSVMPMLLGNPTFIVNSFVVFCFLFFLGNHIRKFGIQLFLLKKHPLLVCILSAMLIPLLTFVMELLLKRFDLMEKASSKLFLLYDLNSPLMIIAGTGLFLFFANMKPHTNATINWFALNMFGVYLIHDNIYFRKFLWHDLLKIDSVYQSNIFLIMGHAFLCVVIIMIAATIVELIRRSIEKLIFKSEKLRKICATFNEIYAEL